MASFAEILAKKPKVQTRQALLVIGLQNDFVSPAGHLPVDTTSGFLDRIHSLISRFRELNGNIIWVQTLYEADRLATTSSTGEGDALVIAGLIDGEENGSQAGDDDSVKDLSISVPQAQSRSAKHRQRALNLFKRVSSRRKALPAEEVKVIVEEDEELFLLKRAKKDAACTPGSEGAQFTKDIEGQIEIPRDAVIKTTNYSAFFGTNLLLTLRARLITEIYVCGNYSNVSVLATVIDGARHGIKINVIQDALGYRKQARHDLAMRRMEDFFDAYIVTTTDVLAKEHFEVVVPAKEEAIPSAKDANDTKDELEKLVGNLSLQDNPNPTSSMSTNDSAKAIVQHTTPSTVPINRSKDNTATQDGNSDEEFAAAAARFRRSKGAAQQPTNTSEPKLVQSKTRMRKKKKKKPTEGSLVEPSASNGNIKEDAQLPTVTREESDPPRAEMLSTKAGNIPKGKSAMQPSQNMDSSEVTVAAKDNAAVRADIAPSEGLNNLSVTDTTTIEHISSPGSLEQISQPMVMKSDTTSTTVDNISSTQPKNATMAKASKLKSLANLPVLGPGDRIATGDSRIIHNLIPTDYCHSSNPTKPLADIIFRQLYGEVRWQKMLHQQGEVPRLVCCQGEFGDDGSKPIYRHPTDQTLPLLHFSPKVQWIRRAAEKLVGHPLNHVLIQLYRSGNDYISEHSDKTLDIAKGSSIVNVSFGAQRTMRLRTKKDPKTRPDDNEDNERQTQRVAMPHNSMFVLGLQSNEQWLHGIMADKRLEVERSDLETAYSGARISLTFRHIATYLDAKETVIWGQGATSKDQRGAADVINNDEAEAERMIRAFSRENHSKHFDWDEWYGEGFDVLHLHAPPEQLPILFAGSNARELKQVQLVLWEGKIKHILLEAPDLDEGLGARQNLVFRDNDDHSTEVEGLSSILHYIDRYHPFCADKPVTAVAYALLADLTRSEITSPGRIRDTVSSRSPTATPDYTATLHLLSEQLENHGGPFIAGQRFSIADCFIWPMLDECVEEWADWDENRWPGLAEYYKLAWKKKACLKKLRVEMPARAKV